MALWKWLKKLAGRSGENEAPEESAALELVHHFAVVTAVHNCESYLKFYFRALARDLDRFGDQIRIVLVDDGSTDRSMRIIRRWMVRYPMSIFAVRQENGGQSSARNAGLDFVSSHFPETDWVTFIDADDFVDRNYVARVDRFIAKRPSDDLRMISCNLVYYDEASRRMRDNHPLRFRFSARHTVLPMNDMGKWMQMSVNSAFFHFPTIQINGLRFDERVRPSFEDAHFVGRFMLWARAGSAAFLSHPRYHYRKRADRSSSMDKARQTAGFYTDVLEYGCLGLIEFYREQTGESIPRHVQRAILYHCCNYISWGNLVHKPDARPLLDEKVREKFMTTLGSVLDAIDDDVIHEFDLANFTDFHEAGVLHGFKQRAMRHIHLTVTRHDVARRAVQLRYFAAEVGEEDFRIDGVRVRAVAAKTIEHRFLDRPFIVERRVWLPLGNKSPAGRMFEARVDRARPTCIGNGTRPYIDQAPLTALLNGAEVRKARSARSKLWLLMDRDTQADDNAEHLYRYLQTNLPDQPIRFVLRRESHDWARLAKDGFDLVAFGSDEHHYLLSVCDKLISSHVDGYVTNYFRDGSMRDKHLVFLQHGVISADLSAWLNQKHIDCFVTSSPAEYESVVSDRSRYNFTRREVVLTGLPRHDALVARAKATDPEKLIVVMPTWRASLVGKADAGNARQVKPGFVRSRYARGWTSLFTDEGFLRTIADAGYRLAIFPHANLEPYIDQLDLPAECSVIRHRDGTFQDTLARASILITDYSSVAFDMALLRKPVVYYQFDRDRAFATDHIYQAGYYDYDRHGFGPVGRTPAEVTSFLHDVLSNGAVMPECYRDRSKAALPFGDGQCCARVVNAIHALNGSFGRGLLSIGDHPQVRETARVDDVCDYPMLSDPAEIALPGGASIRILE